MRLQIECKIVPCSRIGGINRDSFSKILDSLFAMLDPIVNAAQLDFGFSIVRAQVNCLFQQLEAFLRMAFHV